MILFQWLNTHHSTLLALKARYLRFRQPVYDKVRNREPFNFRPGKLSFQIGPLKFYQIPTQRFNFYPCCVDYRANCYRFADCD